MTDRQLFDSVAGEYDVTRPDYPAQLFDALESAMGQPLLWSQACDVGAGTGIASRAMAGRGSTVTAVDPGLGMLRVLAARSTSRVRAVAGDGNALPLRDGLFDVVTYAQSFHWTDPERSLGEAFRVLKPGGVLALWWNRHDLTVPWYAEHEERLYRSCGWRAEGDVSWVRDMLVGPPWGRRVATVEIPWSRRLPIAGYGRQLLTHSHFINLGETRARAVMAAEVAELERLHPTGYLDEPFTTYAVMARN